MHRPRSCSRLAVLVPLAGLLPGLAAAGTSPPPSRIAEAERLAAQAAAKAEAQPQAALQEARRALSLTADFEPTEFVSMGRKGEVVEDEFVLARRAYRRHRARLYQAIGLCQASSGRHLSASRYLRRAVDLEPGAERASDLARSLVALGRGREALDALLSWPTAAFSPAALALAVQAADAAGVPSLQAEIDRARLAKLPADLRIEARDGPFRLTGRERLSTGASLRLDAPPLLLLYIGEASCRTCSADLETLKRAAPDSAQVVLAPAGPDRDQALRRVAGLYRYDWPVAAGPSLGETLQVTPPAVFVVARRGWVGAVVRPPLWGSLPGVIDVLARADLEERVPRPAWNGRPVERRPPAPGPGLLPEGLAPGEDEPFPEAFERAVAAYRRGQAAEALRLFEELEARGDGWLLPPEARLNRALCLAALGRREQARLLLLQTGDSRFEEAVDRALERAGSPPRPSPPATKGADLGGAGRVE